MINGTRNNNSVLLTSYYNQLENVWVKIERAQKIFSYNTRMLHRAYHDTVKEADEICGKIINLEKTSQQFIN